MRNIIKLIYNALLFILLFSFSATVNAQQNTSFSFKVKGNVKDEYGMALPGVNIIIKGSFTGTVSNFEGDFEIEVPQKGTVLQISFIGYKTQELKVEDDRFLEIELVPAVEQLEEIVAVGYGSQKKQSVVGAITQATGEQLNRTGGVTNLGQALTGILPGVSTVQVTGMPGNDDPEILIRAKTTWNNSQPLILVDGIERRMNDVDMSEVESVSVLKDASATAVFGVKGAEGVILITTKRGKQHKARVNFTMNHGFKFISEMPERLNSYDAFSYRNKGIENEVASNEDSWQYIMPEQILINYKQPQAPENKYLYPDVDWTNEMLRNYGLSQRYNINVSGGSKFASYFSSLSYTKEGDILKTGLTTGLPYETEYSYERYNFRSNFDLNITSTTVLSVNLAGYLGKKHSNNADSQFDIWRGLYHVPPGVFPVKYEDGIWGYTALDPTIVNPVRLLNSTGTSVRNTSQMNADFILKQNLDFIVKGWSVQGSFSYDTQMTSSSSVRGSSLLSKYINPINGLVTYSPNKGKNEYDYVLIPEYFNPESVWIGSTARRIFYQVQTNFSRNFSEHDISFTALMNREQYASGSEFPRFREDWVGRLTYNYKDKYLFETNGAYNGSEKFSRDYRYGFFPSLALGWNVSNEDFFNVSWVNNLKIRYSWGKVGNDNFYSPRWPYLTQWTVQQDYTTRFGANMQFSPYPQYLEASVGNPDLQWESVVKQNMGVEVSVLSGLISATFDVFKDHRDHIFLNASQRTVMDYFGASPVSANLGETKAKGYEFEIRLRSKPDLDFRYWLSYSYTFSKDEIIYDESAPLLPDYLKKEGFQIGQTKTIISDGYMTSWDDVYASTPGDMNNNYRIPGDAIILDFNGDGIINYYDSAPYGFTGRPQNTYNLSAGIDYKGLSFMVQFYGVFNTTRSYEFPNVTDKTTSPNVFEYVNDYWSLDNPDANWKVPRAITTSSFADLSYFDGSYLRLKNIELSYNLPKRWISHLKISDMKFKLSGNNLLFWSELPEDRETSLSAWESNLYPNLKRVNIGIDVSF